MGLFGKSKREKELEAEEQQVALLQDRLDKARFEPPLSPIPIMGFVLKRGERAYYSGPADLLEYKTYNQYVGGYSGISFRVARGVRVNTGSSRGTKVATTVAERTDSGAVCITDRRLIFVGSMSNKDISFDKILNLTASPDAMMIHMSNKKPISFVTNDPEFVFRFQLVINGHIEGGPNKVVEKNVTRPMLEDRDSR